MLWQKLIGSTPAALPLQFVGGAVLTASSTSTPSFSLTSLTGGVSSSPSAGDIVVVAVSFFDNTDRDITCTTTGYTELADLYANGSADTQMAVYYKVLTTAETSVAFNTVSTPVTTVCAIHVWRNPNTITPLDVTSTTATSTTSAASNAPSITTATDNAVVIAFGSAVSAGGEFTTLTAPSGMANFFQDSSATAGAAVASAIVSTAGAYDPAAFGGGAPSGTFCAVTVALRPQ